MENIGSFQDMCRLKFSHVPSNRKIEKVAAFVREDNKGHDYDPKVVSIGPYHHGKVECQFLEGFKYKVLESQLLSYSGADMTYYDDIFCAVINDIRHCYIESSTDCYSDPDFARMMLLDTNFLLSYMESLTLYPQVKDFFVKNLGFVTYFTAQRDIFLLENQIPLWVLKMLATLKYGDYDQDGNLQKELFGKFCGSAVFCDYQPTEVRGSYDGKNSEDEQPMHLLETLRDVIISKPIQPKTLQQKDFKTESQSHIYPFRSVRDLKQKGIFFRSSSINSIHGIKFKSYKLFGKLDLPKEHMNIYSKVIYSNMIAYEMSPNTNTRYEVTSYVNFMKSLIVCPEDVKELREKGVICNHLGTDEEAAKVLRDITTYDVVSHGGILVDVIKDIQSHVSSKAKTSMAKCYWTYFSTPWSIIALLVAAALLCLTIMQTHYTMYPMN